jgi:uncharacterized protein YecE (DUF72 family)
MKWHIGCSGFSYREWKETFYPVGLPQRKWFEYYSTRFDTLELNVTFYKFPQLSALQKWYAISPPGFLFSLKAPRLITHYKSFNDCEKYLDDFYNTIQEGLQEKIGCVLFQMPPKFTYSEERLQLIIDNLRPACTNVVEFRHESWWQESIFKKLGENNIVFTGHSHPIGVPDEPVANTNVAYYRFHGVPTLFYSAYGHETLARIADGLLAKEDLHEVFVYFNNTASMAAIENAVWLKQYLERKLLPVPLV